MLIKKLIRFSLKLFLWLSLPLIVIEVLMIGLDPYLFRGFYQYDPDLGFRVRSYHTMKDGSSTNRFGFNDRDYSLQKTPGVFRILIVGDSFNWAGGREGNYATLLEHMLDEQYGQHKIDVINVGYPMTHTGEQLAMLKKYALQYNPDLVILGFFAGNDFFEADPNRKRIIVDDVYVDIDKRGERRFLGYPMLAQSRLLLFIKQKYQIYMETRGAQREAQELAASIGQPVKAGTLTEETLLRIERAKLEFCNVKTPEKQFQKNIDHIFQSIIEMNDLLQSRNIRFAVAIYPGEIQVDPNLFNAVSERFKLNKADYNLRSAQDLLGSFLHARGIRYLDLLDQFAAEGQKQKLYLFRDTHWNSAGNRLAADILFKDLVRQMDAFSAP
jgi:hypothetical protein